LVTGLIAVCSFVLSHPNCNKVVALAWECAAAHSHASATTKQTIQFGTGRCAARTELNNRQSGPQR